MTSTQASEATAVRRGGRFYFVATVVAQAAALLRYVVLARLLGPEQLGLASTLVVTAAFFDMISDTGSDRFLIQNRHGDVPAAQKLVQLVYAGRGALIALALALAAWPVATFYKEPRLAHGIMILALSPLILGLMHLDIRRVQRHLDFRAEAQSLIGAESVSLIVTTVAAFLTRDFTSILYGLIARAAIIVLISHLRAERPYRLGFAREHAAQLARFSGPLMANGLLLFLGSQGDRVIVASRLGVTELGHYSAVLLLIYYPTGVLIRYVHAMYLPLIAACRDDSPKEALVADRLAGQTLLLSVAMASGFAIIAPSAVVILYGQRFAQSAQLVALIGILQTCRYMIVWPTTVALSGGHSGSVLAINIVRLLAYPGAVVGGWVIGGLSGVMAGFIAGEAVSLVAGTIIANRSRSKSMWKDLDRLLLFALVCGFIFGGAASLQRPSLIGVTIIIVGTAGLIAWMTTRERATLADAVDRLIGSRRVGKARAVHPK